MNRIFSTTALLALSCAALIGMVPSAQGAFNIELNYRSPTSPTQEQRDAFEGAKDLWESIITGYVDDNNAAFGAPVGFDGPKIDIYLKAGDGPLGNLGSARPTSNRYLNASGNGFTYALTGRMDFDSDDFGTTQGFNSDVLELIVAHEMGHVLGIGTLWSNNGLYNRTSHPGEYTGAWGIAAYNAEFGQSGTFIPVEQGGGSGTAHFHWNEPDEGAAFTGMLDAQGRDFTYELMTGWLNHRRYLPFISQTTVQSMRDLGYTVASEVPEPSSLATLSLALLGIGWRYRRQRCV